MADRIRDLPVWAEARFLGDCAAAGLTANKSSIDRFGWDYIVEYQRHPVAGVPHDMQLGADTCRVQVKSKTGGSPSVAVKLTNALHFARHVDPCFIVLYQQSRDGSSVKEFVREFDQELMAAALKRARIADRDGEKDLHKIKVTITFHSTHERTGCTAEAIRAVVESKPADHRETKRHLVNTLGFENGGVKASIRFAASDITTFVEHTLGLGAEFKPTDITITRERFSIASSAPIVTGVPERVEIRVNATPARLNIVGADGGRVEFAGEFRSLGMPNPSGIAASFVSRFVKAVLEEGGRLRIHYKHNSADTATLEELRAIVGLHLASRSSMVVGLAVQGHNQLETTAMQLDLGDEPWMDWFARALAILSSLSRPADVPLLSLDDVATNVAVAARIVDLLSDGSLTVATDAPGPDAPEVRCRNLVGHAHITLGNSTFIAIIRRPCLSQEIIDGQMVVRFGDPIFLEGAARRGGREEHLGRLRRRFLELIPRLGAGLLLIDDGDLMAGNEIVTYQP